MKKTVTYLRVSTDEQDVESQRHALAAYCQSGGITVDEEFADTISGTTDSRERLNALLEACERGEIARIVTLRIDRVSRSLINFLALVTRLQKLGVALVCTSQNIDTGSETAEQRMIRNIFAIFAEFESEMISKRVKEGIAVAVAAGTQWGKPSKVLTENWRAIIEAWRVEDPRPGYGELARRLGGVSKSTAWRLTNEKSKR